MVRHKTRHIIRHGREYIYILEMWQLGNTLHLHMPLPISCKRLHRINQWNVVNVQYCWMGANIPLFFSWWLAWMCRESERERKRSYISMSSKCIKESQRHRSLCKIFPVNNVVWKSIIQHYNYTLGCNVVVTIERISVHSIFIYIKERILCAKGWGV